MKVSELIGMFVIILYFFWFSIKFILELISYKEKNDMNIVKFNNWKQEIDGNFYSFLNQSISI